MPALNAARKTVRKNRNEGWDGSTPLQILVTGALGVCIGNFR